MQLGAGVALIAAAGVIARLAFCKVFVRWLTGGPTILTASPVDAMIGDILRGASVAAICGALTALILFGALSIVEWVQG